MSAWSDAVAAAQKVLGKEGKLPKARVDIASLFPAFDKAFGAFDNSRASLEKTLLDLENVLSQMKNTIKQYADMVDGNDFGLDEDKPDDKKKIDQATDIMMKIFKKGQENCDAYLDELSKLDRLVTNLNRLKDLKI